MDTQSDALVIGGGLSGMLAARELALAGHSVALVERTGTGRESSWAGGGILSPLHPWRYPAPVSALSVWSQAFYPEFCRQLADATGIDPEWTQNGMLDLAPGDEAVARAWSGQRKQTMESLDGEETLRIEPALSVARSAVWFPAVAQVRNPRLVKALHAELVRLGVEIREACDVRGLIIDGGRARGAATSHGELLADTVVLAAGAWSATLLPAELAPLPVQPVRGQMLLFRAEPDTVHRIILDQDRYVIPRRDGRVLVGSTMEHVGFNKETTFSAHDELHEAAVRLVPALADYPIEHHWAGLRPGSPDGVPFIGPHPQVKGLWLNTGHFRNGVVMGPASARLLVDLMTGREPILDPTPYLLTSPRG